MVCCGLSEGFLRGCRSALAHDSSRFFGVSKCDCATRRRVHEKIHPVYVHVLDKVSYLGTGEHTVSGLDDVILY